MRAIAVVVLVFVGGCSNDRGGLGTEPEPSMSLANLTGAWQGDSPCSVGRWRFAFDAPVGDAFSVTGRAWFSQHNSAGVCTERSTPDAVTADVGSLGHYVWIYWPPVGPGPTDQVVYRGLVATRRRVSGTLVMGPDLQVVVPPGDFQLNKQ